MVVKLLVLEGETSIKEVTLRRARTVVGRKKGCKVRIRSELVSRVHCVLINQGGNLSIKDLGSANGVLVNDQKIKERALQAGDTIQIGPITFLVQIIGAKTKSGKSEPTDPTMAIEDDDVVFFESDDLEDDKTAAGVDEDDEIDDRSEVMTIAKDDVAGPPRGESESIFDQDDASILDASDFKIPEDDIPSQGDYGLADDPRKKRSRRSK